MYNFQPFDPLKAKAIADTEVAALAQKREIKNILGSYVGWYDPFCELIQNALDAVEERKKDEEDSAYTPTVWITINIKDNSITVTDNGIGLDEEKFTKFLCPDISFKSGNTRGHKGVGATYLAYGFNYIRVSSKYPGFQAVGKMEGARKWLDDESPASNPQMKPDDDGSDDPNFAKANRGVSVKIKFDKTTHPKDLKWIVTDDAPSWHKILSIKTGLGAFHPNTNIEIHLEVVDRNGNITSLNNRGIEYYWPHKAVSKSASIKEIAIKQDELFKKKGVYHELPAKYKNLDAFYERWTTENILEMVKNEEIKLEGEEKETLEKYRPEFYISFVYSLKIWEAIHRELNIRTGLKILYGGIQIAANNMPQGELIQIPLNRNIGRQNQIHCLVHFNNCNPDLGRKGFQSEVVEFAKEITKKIADGPLTKFKLTLRANTGVAPNLNRQEQVDSWKNEMISHEQRNPLDLINENFFLPIKKVSITSKPTREQDVIALFNQLLAGGVIRGIRIMATNERLTYDGLFRVTIEPPSEIHLYNDRTNPLGIDKTILDQFELPFIASPKILEYKFSLDGLIEEIENGTKNSNDIGLVVVWDTGEDYKKNYKITSFLDPNNLTLREYHGITHCITDINSGQREMELIVLSELIDYLKDPDKTIAEQIKKYEE